MNLEYTWIQELLSFSLSLSLSFSRGHWVGILIKCWCLPRGNKLKWNCPSQEHVVLIFYSGVYLLQTQHPHFLPIWPIHRTIINLKLFFGFSLFWKTLLFSLRVTIEWTHLFLQNVSSPAKESRRLEHKTDDFSCSLAPNPWLDESDDCRKLRIDKYDTRTQVWKLEFSTNPKLCLHYRSHKTVL